MATKKRIGFIDIAKAFAMIGIVAGHVASMGAPSAGIPQVVVDWAFSFNVQAFFILSGFFFNPAKPWNPKKDARGILLPYVASCVLVIVFAVVGGKLLDPARSGWALVGEWFGASIYGAGVSFLPTLGPWPIASIGGLWFLPALFIGKALLHLIQRIPQPRFLQVRENSAPTPGHISWANVKPVIVPLVVVVILFLVSALTPPIVLLPFGIQAGCGAAFWIYLGVLIRRFGLFEDKRLPVWSWVLIAVVWALGVALRQDSYPVWGSYPNGVVDVVVAICATFTIVGVAKLIERHLGVLSRAMQAFGRNTLPFFCFHIIDVDLFPFMAAELPIQAALGGVPMGFITVLLHVAIPTAASFLVYVLPRPLAALYYPQKRGAK